jgi:hypothetical protein
MRIVSLLPSATEMICILGLEGQLVGVTHECDYPPLGRRLPKVTHTLIPADGSQYFSRPGPRRLVDSLEILGACAGSYGASAPHQVAAARSRD